MKARIFCAALATLSPTLAGAAIVIDHPAVSCVVAEQYPLFEARFDPGDQVSRALVYFRPEGGHAWYFVTMKGNAGVFSGVIPRPKKDLKSLDYYIEVTDSAFAAARTEEHSPVVVSSAGECKDRLAAGALASSSVVLNAPAGAPLVPAGFSPTGVVAAGAPSGPVTAAAKHGGIGTTALVAGGVVAAGAVVAVAAHGGGGGGGGDTGGGDGNPGGGGTAPGSCEAKPITAALTGAAASYRCGQRLTVGISVTNGSCSSLAIQSVQLHHFAPVRESCQGVDKRFTFAPTLTTLGAGQTGTVLSYASDPFCCVNGPCHGTFSCPFEETFVAQTSAGAETAGTAKFNVSYDPSCPVCPSQ